jgi:integrase
MTEGEMTDAFERSRKKAGIDPWPHNALRHGFASYHYGKHKNANLLAAEMGHCDTKLIFEEYRSLVKPKDAKAYWEIRPESDKADNVIVLAGAVAYR